MLGKAVKAVQIQIKKTLRDDVPY